MANLDNFILFDVAEAIITDKQSGEAFLNKFLTTSGIAQSSSETEIRAGQGAGLIALIESEKSIEINLANGVISKKWLEMQQGAEFKENQEVVMNVTEKVTAKVVEVTPADPNTNTPAEVEASTTITKTPVDGNVSVTIINCKGDSATSVIADDKSVVIPDDFPVADGEEITAIYKAKVSGVESLEIDSAVFPKGWELQLEVPAMDKCTQKVTHKVVFIFDNVRPSSSFDMSFAMGEAIAPEMTLKVMKSCCGTSLGKMVIVPIATP